MRTTARAPAMAPDERRRAIVAATLPLLHAHGASVTTKQIADAAGIAEGTVFRVFPDKETLLRTAVLHAFDPDDALAALDGVDLDAPLEERTAQIVTILGERLSRIFRLFVLTGVRPPPPDSEQRRLRDDDPIELRVRQLLAPDAGRLRYDLPYAVKTLRLLTFAGVHPHMTHEDPLTAEQIVDLFLHGCLDSTAAPTGATAC